MGLKTKREQSQILFIFDSEKIYVPITIGKLLFLFIPNRNSKKLF